MTHRIARWRTLVVYPQGNKKGEEITPTMRVQAKKTDKKALTIEDCMHKIVEALNELKKGD